MFTKTIKKCLNTRCTGSQQRTALRVCDVIMLYFHSDVREINFISEAHTSVWLQKIWGFSNDINKTEFVGLDTRKSVILLSNFHGGAEGPMCNRTDTSTVNCNHTLHYTFHHNLTALQHIQHSVHTLHSITTSHRYNIYNTVHTLHIPSKPHTVTTYATPCTHNFSDTYSVTLTQKQNHTFTVWFHSSCLRNLLDTVEFFMLPTSYNKTCSLRRRSNLD